MIEKVYPASTVTWEGSTYSLARDENGRRLLIVQGDHSGFEGAVENGELFCPLTHVNADALRARLPWLTPVPLGLEPSAGMGDRLGLATPGHVRAIRGSGVAPIFAQQSMRENARTRRTPQQVMDDAMWGLFQEGWREPWGADADHLKTLDDIALCAAVGYTFFTVDPGDHVDNAAHTDSPAVLEEKLGQLPWAELEDSPAALRARYLNRKFDLGAFSLAFDEESLARAACKYSRAVAHAVAMYRRLVEVKAGGSFELEVSVDETDTPTSPLEHLFIAGELCRLGVVWISLAPRFIGRFEKGVDYIGDRDLFKAEVERHAAVVRSFGGYKLSLHSGSDKFSIYPIVAGLMERQVHLKTAGTSYLEALRVLAVVEPELFCEILDFARGRYPLERATYHVSGEVEKVPSATGMEVNDLPSLLEQFDARQVLHVTYGSTMDLFGSRILESLDAHEEAYYLGLERHFKRHVEPFSRQ